MSVVQAGYAIVCHHHHWGWWWWPQNVFRKQRRLADVETTDGGQAKSAAAVAYLRSF